MPAFQFEIGLFTQTDHAVIILRVLGVMLFPFELEVCQVELSRLYLQRILPPLDLSSRDGLWVGKLIDWLTVVDVDFIVLLVPAVYNEENQHNNQSHTNRNTHNDRDQQSLGCSLAAALTH